MNIAPRYACQSRFSIAAILLATTSLFVGSAVAVTTLLHLS